MGWFNSASSRHPQGDSLFKDGAFDLKRPAGMVERRGADEVAGVGINPLGVPASFGQVQSQAGWSASFEVGGQPTAWFAQSPGADSLGPNNHRGIGPKPAQVASIKNPRQDRQAAANFGNRAARVGVGLIRSILVSKR